LRQDGAAKPRPPAAFDLATALSTERMEYSEDIHERIQQDAPPERLDWLNNSAISQIRNISHARDTKAIRGHIESHFDGSGPSALDITLGVHHLISRGIWHFSGHPALQ
jgi:hypothetical protein